jgi:hypothetical protein
MVVYFYVVYDQPTIKQKMRPALHNHQQIYQDHGLYTAKGKQQTS